jgi:hypothetical protein
MTEKKRRRRKLILSINMDEELEPKSSEGRKNFGYAAILKIYHQLGFDTFFKNKARHESFKFNTNSIMILLVIISGCFHLVLRRRLLKSDSAI